MNYFLGLFKTYFKNRDVSFYIGLGAALLSLVSAICYGACLGGLDDEYLNAFVWVLPLLGGIAFLAASLFKQTRVGAIILTALDFSSLIVFAITVYEYPLEQVMTISNVMDIPYMTSIIAVAVLIVISTVLSNVVSWLPFGKEAQADANKGE